jgi:hypothetical protein
MLKISELPPPPKGYHDIINNNITKIKINNTLKKLTSLFLESLGTIKAMTYFPISLNNRLNKYNINLKEITKEQSKKSPIILLHGNFGYWGYFFKLIKAIKKNNLGPIYTVSLTNGLSDDFQKDCKILEKKIEEIKKQYKKHNVKNPKISFIGFSRGAFTIKKFYEGKKWKNVKKIIGLGHPFSTYYKDFEYFEEIDKSLESKKAILKRKKEKFKNLTIENPKRERLEEKISNLKKYIKNLKRKKTNQKKLFEITGKRDFFVSLKSCLPENQKLETNTGHFGILFSKKAVNEIIKQLKTT